MGALTGYARGIYASAPCFLGLPLLSFRMARVARSTEEARQMMAGHLGRFLRRCGASVEVTGTPPQPGQGCVLSYNEPSFVDVAAFCEVMWPHIDRAAGADLYAYLPFGRQAFEMARISLVPRGNRAGTDRLLDEMKVHVRGGDRVAWGGEGRIVGIDGIGHYKVGGMLLAIRAQVPIVPVTFFGGHHVMPFGSLRAKPGPVIVHFGAPIETTGLTEDDARALADRTKAVMQQTYDRLKAGTVS